MFIALADPVRRSLILSLAENSSRSATQIARDYPITRQGIIRHLNVLYDAGLVTTSKKGRDVQYNLQAERLADISEFVKKVEAKLDERLARLKTMLENETSPKSKV